MTDTRIPDISAGGGGGVGRSFKLKVLCFWSGQEVMKWILYFMYFVWYITFYLLDIVIIVARSVLTQQFPLVCPWARPLVSSGPGGAPRWPPVEDWIVGETVFHWSKTDAWKTYPNLTCINESERDLGTVKNSTKLNTKIHTSLSSKIVTITVLKMTIFLIWHLYGLCVVKFRHKNLMIRVRKISLFGFKYLLCCGQGTFVFMVKRNNWLLETGKKQGSPLSKSNTLSRVTRGLCQLSINIRWF